MAVLFFRCLWASLPNPNAVLFFFPMAYHISLVFKNSEPGKQQLLLRDLILSLLESLRYSNDMGSRPAW